MKKSINIYEMCEKLNNFRESQVKMNKSFTAVELNEALCKLGFSKTIASAIAQQCFPFIHSGKNRIYDIPKEPIHRSILEQLYTKRNSYQKKFRNKISVIKSEKISEDEAWEKLIETGKIVRKFNLTLLKQKYPQIYLECLRYEIV